MKQTSFQKACAANVPTYLKLAREALLPPASCKSLAKRHIDTAMRNAHFSRDEGLIQSVQTASRIIGYTKGNDELFAVALFMKDGEIIEANVLAKDGSAAASIFASITARERNSFYSQFREQIADALTGAANPKLKTVSL